MYNDTKISLKPGIKNIHSLRLKTSISSARLVTGKLFYQPQTEEHFHSWSTVFPYIKQDIVVRVHYS